MSTYDWLLFLHVAGAFAVVAALVLPTAAVLAGAGRERPSEIALSLGLTRANVVLFDVGGTVILVFGVLLVLDLDAYDLTDGWVVTGLALWLVTAIAGTLAARTYREARALAGRLAEAGDTPAAELAALVRNGRARVLHAISWAAILAAVAVMIYKPGAG